MSGNLGLLAVTAVAFGATFGMFAIANAVVRMKKQDRRLQERILGSGNARKMGTGDHEETGAELRFLPTPLVRFVERVLDKMVDGEGESPLGRVDRLLQRVAWSVTPAEFIAGSALAGVGGALFGRLLSGTVAMLLLGGLSAAGPAAVASFKGQRRLKKLQIQLPDTLTVLASSLRAGHSFLQALDAVAQEVPEPSASEFKRTVSEIRLGRESQDALEEMAVRVGSEDLKWTVLAISIQREVGGNLAEVLDTVANTIREREQVRRQVEVLSAEGKLSMAVLSGLPLLMAAYMSAVNPEYIGLLFSSQFGIVMVVVGAALWTLGLLWMRKVVRIDV